MRKIRQYLFAFFFFFHFRISLLPQKDARSICKTSLKGVAINQKFKESFREELLMKCFVEFVGQVTSEICASNRHPDVTVLLRKDENINFFCWWPFTVVTYLLNIDHTIHSLLLPLLYPTIATEDFTKENCGTGTVPRHCLENWQLPGAELCDEVFWQSDPIHNRVPCVGTFPSTLCWFWLG